MSAIVESQEQVKLVSSNGEIFNISITVAKVSLLLQSILNERSTEDISEEIPIINVNSPILLKVIEFCEYYVIEPMKSVERQLKTTNLNEIIQEW